MKKRSRVIVSAVLFSKDRKILFGKKRPGGVYPDCWHIPGGGVEQDETLDEALTREIREEVGIDISNLTKEVLNNSSTSNAVKTDKLTGEKYLAKMHFNVYRVNLDKTVEEIQVSLNDDLVEHKWILIEDLKNYKLTPPSVKLFGSLGWLQQ